LLTVATMGGTRMRAAGLAFVSLWAIAGCATVPIWPEKGGPIWREAASAHFRLRSDLDEDDARETIRRLEEIRASMLAMVWPGAPDPPIRTEVIVLRSQIELMVFVRDPHVPPLIGGLRAKRSPLPASLLFAGADSRTMTTLVHELAHDLSEWFLPMQPLWYSEGVATFLETVRYDRSNDRAEIGQPSWHRFLDSDRSHGLSAPELLGARSYPPGEKLVDFENRAWLLVHYLINERPEAFVRLQIELLALKSPTEAWSTAMPDLPPSKLDDALDRYRSGHYGRQTWKGHIPAPAISVRVMTDAEAHAVRAQMFETGAAPGVAPDSAAAQKELTEALEADASNVSALAQRFFWFSPGGQPQDRARLAQRTVSAHPEEWLAWLMVAETATDARARRTALARGLRLAPYQAPLLTEMAQLNATTGQWDEALLFATKATQFGEERWGALALRMEALAHLGRCREAGDLAGALQTIAPPAAGDAVTRTWDGLRRACTEAAEQAGPSSATTTGP
jgi:Tfp pilus assembly protein PilF